MVGGGIFALVLWLGGAAQLAAFASTASLPAWSLILALFVVAVAAGALIVAAVIGMGSLIARVSAERTSRVATATEANARRRLALDRELTQLESCLRQLKPAERQFLDLFAPHSATAQLMQDGLLPRDIYGAVHHLLQSKIIERVNLRTDAQYTERFRLVEVAIPLVQSLVLSQPVGHREIELSLDRVEGTGSSGGGARGGRY